MNAPNDIDRYLAAIAAGGRLGKGQSSQSLKIAAEGDFEVFYAPFDHVNEQAQLVICGQTPGMLQASLAVNELARLLGQGIPAPQAMQRTKEKASFAGTMRDNLCSMLDYIGVQQVLGITSCSELFDTAKGLVHYTSALRYPVFYRGANYSGSPSISQTPLLRAMVQTYLAEEAKVLPKQTLWVPLGREATYALTHLVETGVLDETQLLDGMPHPSTANQERIAVFLDRKSPTTVSVKTNPDRILQAREGLLECVQRMGRLRGADRQARAVTGQGGVTPMANHQDMTEEARAEIQAAPRHQAIAMTISSNESLDSENSVEQQLVRATLAQGYRVTKQTKKKIEITHADSGAVVYIDRTRATRGRYALVLHPDTRLESLRSIALTDVPEAGRYFHSSNLTRYPKRMNGGENLIGYGYSITCESVAAATHVLQLSSRLSKTSA